MDSLDQLAKLIATRNRTAVEITKIIGRPAQIGHVGEFIASHIFDIRLEESAVAKGMDGVFRSGALAGKSVNIKWYGKRDNILDITPNPDSYLVMTGPKGGNFVSRGEVRPWLIESVFVFDAKKLVESLQARGLKIGIATSVRSAYWADAEVYPRARSSLLTISPEQRRLLALYGEP